MTNPRWRTAGTRWRTPGTSRHTLAAAATMLAVLAVGTGIGAAAPARSAETGGPASPNSVPIPDGYERFIDDTATIMVGVPNTWAYVQTSPNHYEDGTVHPVIYASQTLELLSPWFTYEALPYQSDVNAALATESLTSFCTQVGNSPYNDGYFVGIRTDWSCQASDWSPTVHVVAANPPDAAFTARIEFHGSAVDEPVFDVALQTFEATGGPYPAGQTPVQSPAPGPAPAAGLPPAIPDYSSADPADWSVWPFGDFRNAPQLGREPVRGSGCGSNGQIGAQIPDGLWAGYVTGFDPNNVSVSIDLLCIFTGPAAQAVLDAGTANIVSTEPDSVTVNNSTRLRTVSARGLQAIIAGTPTGSGGCAEGDHSSPEVAGAAIAAHVQQQSWIRIHNGEVTWIFFGCDATASPPPAAPSGPLPAPFAAANGTVWPYGEFWNVPQLGEEPVRGSGCGSSGEIGPQIPDGLWAGYIASTRVGPPAIVSVDLLCIFAGATAETVIAQGSPNIVSAEPNYVIVNNNPQVREVPMDGSIALRLGVLTADGRCVDGQSTLAWADIGPQQQVWIRIHNGRVTWVFAGC